MQARDHTVLVRAVEKGIEVGINRAYEYRPNLNKVYMKEQIACEVMNAIHEVFDFDEVTELVQVVEEDKSGLGDV